MFSHLFFFRLKTLLREKTLVFWTLVFPFILSTLFHLVFAGFGKSAAFSPIPVALVDNEAYRENIFFARALTSVSSGDSRLLDLVVCSDEKSAEALLREGKIRGYILAASPMEWHVARSGLSQSMVKAFLDQYAQVASAVQTILGHRPEALPDLLRQLGDRQKIIRPFRDQSPQTNLILILYYALLAMSCLYGAFYGLSLVQDIHGNLSARAARVNVAPVHKLRLFMAGMLASFTVHMAGLLLFLAYLIWLLGVDFGGKEPAVLAAMVVGSVTGLFLGAFVGLAVLGKEGTKVATLSSVTLTGAFLAGMMAPGVKYQISQNLPLLSWLNPVNLLADAFYALYYYDNYLRYGVNMGGLALFALLFCAGSYLIIRRRQYVSL